MSISSYFFSDSEDEDDSARSDLSSVSLEFMSVLAVSLEFSVGVELVCEALGVSTVVDEFTLLLLVDALVKSFSIPELARILAMASTFSLMESKYFVLSDSSISE